MALEKSKKKRILIVEDNKDMQTMYGIFFSDQMEKYEVEIESNAEKALKRLMEKEIFDLIILDIIMEPISGDSVCIYIREKSKDESTPVLFITVLNPNMLANLKKMNNVAFLQKPITKEQLLKRIDMMVLS